MRRSVTIARAHATTSPRVWNMDEIMAFGPRHGAT
jgi:hypothetical protein